MDLLLVDDDALQAETRRAILELTGLTVAVKNSGFDALQFLRSPAGAAIRMVVTDHLMPGMNGPEFVRLLRADGLRIAVLVLSGYAEAEEEYDALDVSFRLKPFPPDQLIPLIQYLLANSERRTA